MLDHQDLSAVRAAAQAAVAAAIQPALRIEDIQPWGGGAHNSGFKLLLEDGARLFLKIEKANIFPRTRRCQIEREVYGIKFAARAGLDVPRIAGFDFSEYTAGCRWLLEEFVDRELLGEALEPLSEEQRAPLLAEFDQKAQQLYAIPGYVFGELHPNGWLGQYDSWRETVGALSAILLDDAQTLGIFSASEMQTLRDAHAFALDAVLYEGPAILTHNDLHIWNAFVEPHDGAPHVGKLFDFGLSLFQAAYLSRFGQSGFDGKEAEVAKQFSVRESELRGFSLISGLEMVNFLNTIHFAPNEPYGCLARRKAYLRQMEEACGAML